MRHHTGSCQCDICYRRNDPEARREYKEKEALRIQEDEKCKKLVTEVLGITLDTQHSRWLYDIFTDDEKCKALISKLKNKAFW